MVDSPVNSDAIETAVAEFNLAPRKAKKIVEAVTIEERQFGVSGEAREDFARLYDAEIKRLGECPLKKIGTAPKDTKKCRVPLLNFQHFLVHHQIHLMLMADSRVQKQTNTDSRELVYPTSEKTMRAALGPVERKRMLQDRERKRRELSR